MYVIYLCLIVATASLISLIPYILYKLEKNRTDLDLLLINVGYLLSSLIFLSYELSQNQIIKDVLIKYFRLIEFIVLELLLILIYELITKKMLNKKYKFLVFTAVILFLFGTLDVLILKYPPKIYDIFIEFEPIIILATFLICTLKSLDNMSSKTKTNIIKWFFILIIVIISDSIINNIFHVPDNSELSLSLNIVFIFYFLRRLENEINLIKRKLNGLSEENNKGNLEEKLNEMDITEREKEVALLIKSGKSNKEIADELFISIHTVKIHVSNIYKKLELRKRADLINLFNKLQRK